MTDRANAIVAILAKDTRVDDLEATLAAISQLKGVISVRASIADISDYAAYERAKTELREKLWAVLAS